LALLSTDTSLDDGQIIMADKRRWDDDMSEIYLTTKIESIQFLIQIQRFLSRYENGFVPSCLSKNLCSKARAK
jgi:hypothetical protein